MLTVLQTCIVLHSSLRAASDATRALLLFQCVLALQKVPSPALSLRPSSVRTAAWSARMTMHTSRSEDAENLAPNNTMHARVHERLRSVDCVCFDVDSTLCIGEGIDELAQHCGVYDEVKKLTAQAMDGNTSFQESLRMRLGLIRPSQMQMEELLEKHPMRFSANVEDLVKLLHGRGVHVYLVSGGFTSMVRPMAKELGIPMDRVYANELRFSPTNGEYVDFNPQCLTSCSGGKGRVMQHIKAFHDYKTVVMIGDGATDLEARCEGGADLVIGYGGNVVRERVEKGADWFVYDFKQVIDALKNRRTSQEILPAQGPSEAC